MSDKKLGLILLGVALLVIVGFGVWKLTDSNDTSSTNQVTTGSENQEATDNTDQPSQLDTKTVSADEVKVHNSKDDCWTIISGKVYDITEYIPNHPGGDEILRACGDDGTQLFTERTDDDGEAVGSGTPHSPTAESLLADFYIGDLATI